MSDTFTLVEGDTGSGKSATMASWAVRCARRNRKWHNQALAVWERERAIHEERGVAFSVPRPVLRELWSCMRYSKDFVAFHGGYGSSSVQGDGHLLHHFDSEEFHRIVPKLRNCDIFIDELAASLPADGWKDTPLETRRFLAQHRKRGLEIYANTQDFAMIDINARRMMGHVIHASKLIGSRDISPTKPAPKYIWGIVLLTEIVNFKTATSAADRQYGGMPDFLFLDRDLVEVYDTTEDIKGAGFAPFRHVQRACELHGTGECDHVKTVHI